MKTEAIARVELNSTKSGKPVAELFSANTALQYPVLRLFNLALLEDVGIDPNRLSAERPVHRQFMAHYSTSQKTNGQGVAYKDVIALEGVGQRPDTDARSDDLVEIRRLLRLIVEHLEIDTSPPPDPPPATIDTTTGELKPDPTLRYGDGTPVGLNKAELIAFMAYAKNGDIPKDIDVLREWVTSAPADRVD